MVKFITNYDTIINLDCLSLHIIQCIFSGIHFRNERILVYIYYLSLYVYHSTCRCEGVSIYIDATVYVYNMRMHYQEAHWHYSEFCSRSKVTPDSFLHPSKLIQYLAFCSKKPFGLSRVIGAITPRKQIFISIPN